MTVNRLNPDVLESIIETAAILNRLNDFSEMLRVISEKSMELLQTSGTLVMILNPDTQRTIKTAIRTGAGPNEGQLRNLKTQITGWMLQNQSSLISKNILEDERFKKLKLSGYPIKSVIATTIWIEDEPLGSLIAFNSPDSRELTEQDLVLLGKFSIVVAPYLRNLEERRKFFAPEISERTLLKKYVKSGLLGESQIFIDLLQVIESAARCDVRVVLEGQTGTGKELVARAIHRVSRRSDRPFVAIDCGAIPDNLIESELFGYKRGAFTGANNDRKGLLEEANHGTLFMDEIANLPFEIQAKLLRFLQEGEVRPLGSNESRKVDVRIISAASQSLLELTEEEKFRKDLYFRLYVYPITVPTLEERREDITMLALHFLRNFAQAQNRPLTELDSELSHYLQVRNWPGNIRELENFIERLVTIAPENAEMLSTKHLPPDLKKDYKQTAKADSFYKTGTALNERVAKLEEQLIRKALEDNDWNQSKAARALDIAEHTMRYKMKNLRISKTN